MAQRNLGVLITDANHEYLERLASQHEGTLAKQGIVRLLLQQAEQIGWDPIDSPLTLTERAPASVVSKSSSSSSASKKKFSIEISLGTLSEKLAPHKVWIREFWQSKKGAKSETAFNLLIENLEKIHAKYGAQVLEEQLKLGINGRWQSITLKNLETFAAKGATPAQPEVRHPASRVFTAKDFDGPRTGGVLSDLAF